MNWNKFKQLKDKVNDIKLDINGEIFNIVNIRHIRDKGTLCTLHNPSTNEYKNYYSEKVYAKCKPVIS